MYHSQIGICETYIECSQHIHIEHRNPETSYHLWVKRSFDITREAQSFYAGFFICTPPTRVAPATRPLQASESHPSSSDRKTQLNWLFKKSQKSSARTSGAWRHSNPLVNLSVWDFYFDICERHILPRARVNTCAHVCT